MLVEAYVTVKDAETGRTCYAEIPAEAFDPASGLTDDEVWERYLKPAFVAVRQIASRLPHVADGLTIGLKH